MEAFEFMRELGFDQPWYIIRPLHIFQFLIVIEVEVVQLTIVQLRVQHFSNQLVYVLHLPIHVFLEHSEAFCSVENLESGHPAQKLQ